MIISLAKAREIQLKKELNYISTAYDAMGKCGCIRCRTSPVISVINDDNKFVASSEGLVDLLGWNMEELTQKTFIDVTHEHWHKTSYRAAAKVRKTGELEFSKYLQHRNGRIIPAHLTGRLSYMSGERVIVGFIRPLCRRLVEKMNLQNLKVYPHLAVSN